ncbi:bifunctional precorrin-2 dehydrogenase/sirohydrochlorin ferrochelatase [Sphingomonas sp. TZW2008]|uniref:precorrin-2 dehydrogenase/sirohydrochlorin ferrochelatase family protein n=1 Tax=Sphingomonas sp. TZW2008 TaxID=1917973 RepID=UPI000A267249|nr:siroheme synthase [Sphingomonas sp. TZW2008]
MSFHSLPIFVRLQGRSVILVGSGEAAAAKRRLLDRAGAIVVGEDAEDARLAIVVDDDAAVARLKARGILVNAVDRVELCDFTLPAIVDRDPVLVAIGTGGASAGLAAALRQRLEALLPAGLGRLAERLFAARSAWRARYPDASARRRAIAASFAPGGAYDPLQPDVGDASGLPPAADDETATIVRMRLTSADPDDLTLRQARLLANADRVCHAADVPRAILDRARADADRLLCDAPPTSAEGLTVDVRMA